MKLRQLVKLLIPVFASAVIGLLITLLVFSLVKFSNSVTQIYTPTILAAENFKEATAHLQATFAKSHDHPIKGGVAYNHFLKAYSQLKTIFISRSTDKKQLHGANSLNLTSEVLTAIELLDHEKANKLLNELKMTAATHSSIHSKELVVSENRIRQFSYLVAGLCFLILVFGAVFTLHEHRLQETQKREVETFSAITALINALEAKDPYTKGHSSRVSELSVAVAGELGLNKSELRNLHLAALMHDIGKIGVPDKVLLKETGLTDEEYALIKEHPKTGAKIVKDSKSLNDIIPGILYHHERYDGKGYPEGLSGEEIPLCAQALSISDAFDAMTSSRPYRKAMSVDDALREIEACRGRQWSFQVVDAFLLTFQKGPVPKEINSASPQIIPLLSQGV